MNLNEIPTKAKTKLRSFDEVTKLSLADKHDLRALRSFALSDFRDRRGEEAYHRALRAKEAKLSTAAKVAWFYGTANSLGAALDSTETIEERGDAKIIERGGRFVFVLRGEPKHDISSDPRITSPERLKAHWHGFLSGHGIDFPPSLSELSRSDLAELVRDAKRRADGDGAYGGGQVLVLDKDGNRLTSDEGPAFEFGGSLPALRDLRKAFENYPAASRLSVEGMTFMKGEFGNAIERHEDREPCDWWTVEIER
jgi:hypothetical protein